MATALVPWILHAALPKHASAPLLRLCVCVRVRDRVQVVVLSQLSIVLHNVALCPAEVWALPAVSNACVALLDVLQVGHGC